MQSKIVESNLFSMVSGRGSGRKKYGLEIGKKPLFRALSLVIAAILMISLLPGELGDVIVWVRQFGSWSSDTPMGISVDVSGVYVAGFTFGALPGQIYEGWADVFLRKYDYAGTEIWTNQFGTLEDDFPQGISADATGVYVAGHTSGTLPGQTNAGGRDAFVRKYDHTGTEIWTRQFGTSSSDIAYGISVDATGVYVAGDTSGALPGQTNSGGDDAFVRKYDHTGTEIWTRQFGTYSTDIAYDISVDGSGVYVAGTIMAGGILPGQTWAGGDDAFVRKYDREGNEVWTRQFGTSTNESAHGVSVNSFGVYVAGWTHGIFPGQNSAGGVDAFVRKYDYTGTEIWTNQFGTPTNDWVYGVSLDISGAYVAGATVGALPGQTNIGYFDAFARKYDHEGTEVWTHQFGTDAYDNAYGISVDSSVVYVAGETEGAFPGQTYLGSQDAFVAKLVQDLNQSPVAVCKNIEIPADINCQAGIAVEDIDDGSYDPDEGDTITLSVDNIGPFSIGEHYVNLAVTDSYGESDTCTATVTVIDNITPEISLSVSPNVLWPPNHKMVPITPAITVGDNCDPSPSVELTSIIMNEGEETNTYDPEYDSTLGDGNTTDDILIDENGNIYLRAERSGAGTGRIYTITFTVTDASGNSTSASATVSVPHNQ